MHWHLEGKECCICAIDAANTQHPTNLRYLDTKRVESVSITVFVGSHLSVSIREIPANDLNGGRLVMYAAA